jgi:MFS family permease
MPLQPMIAGAGDMIVAGHSLAAEAGHAVLEAGGNAVDAGVAAGITLGAVHRDQVQVSGVAPIILYLAERDEVVTVSGLGPWPRAATLELFVERHGGTIPGEGAPGDVPGAAGPAKDRHHDRRGRDLRRVGDPRLTGRRIMARPMPTADAPSQRPPLPHRLPFFYGWVVVAVAFVTMGVGVNTRTAFSLLFPPIVEEFAWGRGVTAAAFSIGFLAATLYTPFLGLLMDRWGPRAVIPLGAVTVSAGLSLATLAREPWQLHLTFGVLVVGGSVTLAYIGHSLFLPHWFVRRRGLAIGLAFSGVGVGSILLFPWLQGLILRAGWRQACLTMALLMLALVPLNLVLQRGRPEDLGLEPDGEGPADLRPGQARADNVVDPAWAAVDWTLARAVRTARFWWVFLGFFSGLFAWYAVQVHQTKYLIEVGFDPALAAYALGFVALTGIAGQVGLGHLSDRIGREWVWALSSLGFVLCYLVLLLMRQHPAPALVYLMVAAQGALGYGLASVFGPIVAELFQGRHFGTIFGTLNLASGMGAAAGPWVTGLLHDLTGSYAPAFWLAIGLCLVSTAAIWLAAPRRVRAVAGQVPRLEARRPAAG